ncbi:unnamed protein product [Simian adenovirus 39]
MKAVSALVFCSLIGIVFSAGFLKNLTIYEGENATLVGISGQNVSWLKYHLDGWKDICDWNVTVYTCNGVNLTITNATQDQNGRFKGQSFTRNNGYESHNMFIYDVTVIRNETATTQMPTTHSSTTTSMQTTQTTTFYTSTQHITTTAAKPSSAAPQPQALALKAAQPSTTTRTNEQTTDFLSTVESHTTATSSAFSSTANLSSLSSTPISPATTPTPALLPTPLKQTENSGMQWQITLLIVIGLVILAVLLYYIFCRRIPNAHRKPVYKPIVIGQPEPLQVEGGLRNLLFSFTVW